MSYFFCSGVATVSEFALQCSEVLQAYQPPTEEDLKLSELIAIAVRWSLYFCAILFIFQQIKKAIEAD